METPVLLAVPNISEGRSGETIAAVGRAFAGMEPSSTGGSERSAALAGAVRLIDVHSDGDHHRSVFTIAGRPGALADALVAGARAAIERIDVMAGTRSEPSEPGQHPHVGALDVMPVVYLEQQARGAACAEALVVADRIGAELEVPVFLYGELTTTEPASVRSRAQLRRGGVTGLAERMGRNEISPDFGPARMHPTAGATLVAARPPLVAFNLELAQPATLADARRIASLIREGGPEGLPGLRAIGVAVSGDRAQVSMNVERPLEVPLAIVIEAVSRHSRVDRAELVGLAPLAALEGLPEGIPMPGFDPARHVIENAIGC
jgi:glutamate formiminotransferase/glutamate formiminotransferase/formiminotetrahydrofolate cyclodeaminase